MDTFPKDNNNKKKEEEEGQKRKRKDMAEIVSFRSSQGTKCEDLQSTVFAFTKDCSFVCIPWFRTLSGSVIRFHYTSNLIKGQNNSQSSAKLK